ncbi:unnamed protein product [Schistosoma margrebowiei]|uniref:V-type proton ATPase subunit C n=1 Tax=Schistosoma margrebowiei TaxID=48269 RepID=A0A183LNL3_9TREM|nr:unnamed protein product [Schistosoma margrebowiei]
MCMLRGNCLIGSNSSPSITKKVAQYMSDVLEEQKHKLEDNLTVNGRMGSLLTRELGDIVKREQFIVDSEYLTTLVVVVPKFVVRDFTYDEKKIEESRNELSKLESDKKRQFAPLFRWLKVNFGEAFSAMVHIKALRVFVESVLRYGLPVDFQAILLEPNKKQQKKLRDILKQLYNHLDGSSSSSVLDEDMNVGSFGASSDYFPYVSFKVELNMIDVR